MLLIAGSRLEFVVNDIVFVADNTNNYICKVGNVVDSRKQIGICGK